MSPDPHLTYWREALEAALDDMRNPGAWAVIVYTDDELDRGAKVLKGSFDCYEMAFPRGAPDLPRQDPQAEARTRSRLAELEAAERSVEALLDRYYLAHNVDRHRLYLAADGHVRER